MMAYLTRPAMARGGRIGFDNGGQTMVEQAKELGISKSALRKPFAPEIEEKIIKLHQVDKMGAEAIANELGLPRSSVGKRITALKKEGKIKDIPYAERKAAIDQRGEFFDKPAAEKFQKIREVRDIDRTTRYRVGPQAGQLKYDIPKNAKFKIDFKTAGGLTSDIPENLQGVQYYTTKKQAEKALAKRKKLKLKADVDPDEVRRSANQKKYNLVKEVSDNNIERILADFKKGAPLEQAHRLSLDQVKKTGQLYNVMNLGLDFDSPELVQINNEAVKPFENKLKQLYAEQNKLYKQASNLKTIPKELQKQIEFNNKKISTVVDLAGGRVQGLQLDEFTLKPKVYGTNYANVLGFGLYDKPVKELTDVDRAGIGAIMQGQVNNEKKTAGKTAQKLFANAQLLNDVDKLAVKSPPINQDVVAIKQLAALGDGSCAVEFGPQKKDGGRIGYANGPASLSRCLESGAKNLNEGKFKTAGQAQDAAKLLGGGQKVLRGLIKYGIVPEAAYVAGEAVFRNILGEKPLNALKKSIDSFTLGLTDYTSGIEAKKFGRDADRKLAVDKFRNSQALVDSLQKKLANLESITNQAGEGYLGDLTSDIQMTQAQLKAAKNELQKNTVSSDIVQFIDRKALDIADAQMAKSDYAEQSLKDQMEGIPGIRDYTDTESTRIFPKQPSQMDLNLKILPQMPRDLFTATPSDIEGYAKQLKQQGVDASPRDVEAYRDLLKSMSLSESADAFSPEQVYGASGVFSQPLAGGGIAKLAGVDQGPPPESGPMSQGLLSLKNRVKTI